MDKIRLGVIGCGIAAKKLHWPALSRLSDRFEIVAVCNHTEPKAAEFSALVGGVPWVLDYRKLLAMKSVEAVDIVLPIHLNFRVTRDALAAGKHVILEKPIAANLADARTMLAFPGKYRRVMMIAENCRYQPVYLRALQALEEGAIGRPYTAVWNNLSTLTTDNPYAQTQWRIHHRYPGGFLTDAGVHNVAVLRMLFGEIVAVTSYVKAINRSIGKTDTLGMIFKAKNGFSGSLNLFFSAKGVSEHRLMIFGTQGTLVVEENAVHIQRPGKPDEPLPVEDDGGYVGEFLEFSEAIRNGAKVKSSFREGARDLQVILVALQAAGTGRTQQIRPI